MDFLQKPLACFSRFYLSVQSKICGRNIFCYSSFLIFFRILSENFSDFWPKNLKKLSKLPSACAEEHFVVWKFFKSFESFWIFCKNLWHGSQFSIFVSRVKTAEEIVFLFFFSEFFRKLSENFFWLLAREFQEVVKTTFYVSTGTIFGLKVFLFKVLNLFGFSAESFGMVLRILSTCPE